MWKMLSAFLQKKLVNVGMRMDGRFYKIFMNLYDRNIFEYARSGPKSMIFILKVTLIYTVDSQIEEQFE